MSDTSRVLSASELLAAGRSGQRAVSVDLPDLGRVYVRRLSAAGLDGYYQSMKDVPAERVRGTILVQGLCNEEGKQLYAVGDAGVLSELDAVIVEPIIDEFWRVNGIGRRGN